MENIAIVVIAFNRLDSIKRLLGSLNNVKFPKESNITLHISIDKDKKGSKQNQEVIEYAKKFYWQFGNKVVDVKRENMGLKKHILECGNLTKKYENIIVLEDDVVVLPLVYKYAEQIINYYRDDMRIAGFGLYSFQRNLINNLPFFHINNASDVFFMQYACSWGQIWTKNRWKEFYDWYQKNSNKDFSSDPRISRNIKQWGENSWLKYHIIYCIMNKKYFVYPQFGLATNFSEIGEHSKVNSIAFQCYTFFDSCDDIDITFKFCELDKAYNVYDAYYENEKLKILLNTEKDIIADFYGEKDIEYIKKQKNKLLLSTKKYDYKILKSYSLQMYPYEQNVVNNINGKDLFLYDTDIYEKNKNEITKIKLYKYLYRLDSLDKKDLFYLIKLVLINIRIKILNKIHL